MSTAEPERSKRRSKKSVRFHKSTKKHDGLSELSKMYYEAILHAYRKSRKPVVSILAHDLNLRGLIYVQKKFSDLIRRCLVSKKGRAPVLKGGGGDMSIDRTHLYFLYTQIADQDRMISRVRTTIARRQARLQLNRAKQEQESK